MRSDPHGKARQRHPRQNIWVTLKGNRRTGGRALAERVEIALDLVCILDYIFDTWIISDEYDWNLRAARATLSGVAIKEPFVLQLIRKEGA